ncbi:hypothetical protein [uncultured Celeribacter sp.]|uniref:hypothetical protein n=1 Tax=uncultured Celeribacter sp. TaxID=1303376 RepID=UPI002AA92521|nr:hypothetical protein [uncultured Celeribacter sp.]
MTAGVSLEGLQVVICAGEGDGFLSNVLNGAEVTVPITFGLDYATDTGLRFNGGAGVEIEIVVDEKLGPAHLQLLIIGAGIGVEGARGRGRRFSVD